MKYFYSTIVCMAGCAVMFTACNEGRQEHRRPIVLGDSSTIVTENNPEFLNDYVTDIQLKTEKPPQEIPDTTNNTATAVTPATEEKHPDDGNGLSIPFKEVTIFIPGIATRTYKTQDLQKATGATYELTSGKLNNSKLQINGATISDVYQRYISIVTATTDQGTLVLEDLDNLAEWTKLKGSGNTYNITRLDEKSLEAKNATAVQIRAAVTKAAKNRRFSRPAIQKWEQSVRNVKSVRQPPLDIKLRSVMWKIEGKDAKGKPFQKQVRIDIPL